MLAGNHHVAKVAVAVAWLVMQQGPRADWLEATHDAYVWQRRWTPAVETAIRASADHVRCWRVLGAEVRASGTFVEVSPSHEALRASGRAVVLVVRMDGQIAARDDEAIATRVLALVRRWRERGLPVVGLEIDHDCATARLVRYARLLDRLQEVRAAGLDLSVTALPSWMESTRVRDLFSRVDETVLQVHSVSDPRAGLFDGERAYEWIRRWAGLSPVPFRVALPAYGSRVTWDDNGNVRTVESEMRRMSSLTPGAELFVRPLDVAGLLERVRRSRLPRLAGVAWFRLPTDDDRRAWSRATWHAVIEGHARRPTMTASLRASDVPGASNVYVTNHGPIDDWLPREVQVHAGAGCEAADAVSPYQASRVAGRVMLRLTDRRAIAAGSRQLVGWVRCSTTGGDAHVRF